MTIPLVRSSLGFSAQLLGLYCSNRLITGPQAVVENQSPTDQNVDCDHRPIQESILLLDALHRIEQILMPAKVRESHLVYHRSQHIRPLKYNGSVTRHFDILYRFPLIWIDDLGLHRPSDQTRWSKRSLNTQRCVGNPCSNTTGE